MLTTHKFKSNKTISIFAWIAFELAANEWNFAKKKTRTWKNVSETALSLIEIQSCSVLPPAIPWDWRRDWDKDYSYRYYVDGTQAKSTLYSGTCLIIRVYKVYSVPVKTLATTVLMCNLLISCLFWGWKEKSWIWPPVWCVMVTTASFSAPE